MKVQKLSIEEIGEIETHFVCQSINIAFIILGKYNFGIALPLVAPSIVLMTLL